MNFNVVFTLVVFVAVLAVIFALFYHAFSIGKEEEVD
jgi:hypothetical protein